MVFALLEERRANLAAQRVRSVNQLGVPPMCWTLGLCGRVMVVVVLPFVWWLMSDGGVEPAGGCTRLSIQYRIDRRAWWRLW